MASSQPRASCGGEFRPPSADAAFLIPTEEPGDDVSHLGVDGIPSRWRTTQKNGGRPLTAATASRTGARRSRKTWKRHDSRTKLITVIRFRIIPGWRRLLHLGNQRQAQLVTSAGRAKTDDF